ncbi:UPF0272 protein [Clostridia bacterium]|nr:UPF0272 protein [Clostridia bacterium]
MKTLFLECNMGIAGDMFAASLLELFDNPDEILSELNNIGIHGVHFHAEKTEKRGILGTRLEVSVHGEVEGHHHHEHTHSTFEGITSTINKLDICDNAKENAIEVYTLLAEAESAVHGRAVSEIHFHEVGNLDAIADIVSVCVLIDKLSPEHIVSSPIATGSGTVKCAHGILPVPAPATALLLKGIPIFAGNVAIELCTPTGAALARHFVQEFSSMPVMTVDKIGYGMGTKDFDAANCVRAFWGALEDAELPKIAELSCNIDDMTPEELGFAFETLLREGAFDVFFTPIVMKKNRAAVILTCLVPAERADCFAALLIKHTTTFGVRRADLTRYELTRTVKEIPTKYGNLRVKTGTGFGVTKSKPEYDDLARIAKEQNISILDIGGFFDGSFQ